MDIKKIITVFITISIFCYAILLNLMNGCTPKINKYYRNNDWQNGYREGFKDGKYMGYKIREMEIRDNIKNEDIHESD